MRFLDGLRLFDGGQVYFQPLDTPWTSLQEDHFRTAAATVENTGNRLAVRLSIGTHQKNHYPHTKNRSESAPPAIYELSRWQTVENERVNFTDFYFRYTPWSRHLAADYLSTMDIIMI